MSSALVRRCILPVDSGVGPSVDRLRHPCLRPCRTGDGGTAAAEVFCRFALPSAFLVSGEGVLFADDAGVPALAGSVLLRFGGIVRVCGDGGR